jgi:hypothetical protein
MTTRTSTVRAFEPSPTFNTLTRVGNVVMRPLIRSRMGAHMHDFAVISFTGRTTGRRYAVPVGYQEMDGQGLIMTAAAWKANLRGGADVEVVHDGRTQAMRADLIEDDDEVADVYVALLQRLGRKKATQIGLRISGDHMPTHDELAQAVDGKRAIITLGPR